MIDMISFLSNYREDTPDWLENYLRGEQIIFKDIMSSRVAFFPRHDYDGVLMKVGNMSHSVHSFLYVDLLKRKNLEAHLAEKDCIRGYHPIRKIEWSMSGLVSRLHPFNINLGIKK